MHEKMTDEQMTTFREVAAGDVAADEDTLREWVVLAAAHIASLTDERDSLASTVEAERVLLNLAGVPMPETEGFQAWRVGQLVKERDALRKRVKALEADVERQYSALQACQSQLDDRGALERRADTAESRLAAIRQRLAHLRDATIPFAYAETSSEEERQTLRDACAAADVAMGPDAPAPSEMDGLRGEMAGPAALTDPPGCVTPVSCSVAEPRCRHHEPTVPEAFATVREALGFRASATEVAEARAAIALLERRMGAQEAAIRECLRLFDIDPAGLWSRALDNLRAALTGAPPVFTLEAVEEAMRGAYSVSDAARRDTLARLAALRR